VKRNYNYNAGLKYEVNASQFRKHAFLNLLDNAIKYSTTGSSVEITITNHKREWKVSIKDHGKGIPDEFKPRIFDRFVRGGAEGGIKGSGIWLAIAKTVVMKNKGRIWVEDNHPQGAVFCIALPKWK
jgi:signal transduction histidine kinase